MKRNSVLLLALTALLAINVSVGAVKIRRIKSCNDSNAVYMTPDDSVYHMKDCPLISNRVAYAMSLRLAKEKGCKPCETCFYEEVEGPKEPVIAALKATRAEATSVPKQTALTDSKSQLRKDLTESDSQPSQGSGNWKNEITKLGFYVVAGGRIASLDFHNLGEGETERRYEKSDFEEKHSKDPVLRQGDSLLLFGDMPAGPLGTTVEVFKIEYKEIPFLNSGYYFEKNIGEARDFFELVPLPPINGQKLAKLDLPDSATSSFYCLHKFIGLGEDGYAFFRIAK